MSTPVPPKPAPPPSAPEVRHNTEDLEAALEGVHDLGALPLADHVARFNTLHESMITALAAVDEV